MVTLASTRPSNRSCRSRGPDLLGHRHRVEVYLNLFKRNLIKLVLQIERLNDMRISTHEVQPFLGLTSVPCCPLLIRSVAICLDTLSNLRWYGPISSFGLYSHKKRQTGSMNATHQTGYVATIVKQATKKTLYSFADHAGVQETVETEYTLATKAAEIRYT